MRHCRQCGAEDRLLPSDQLPGIEDRGELDIPHFVSPLIEFLKPGQQMTLRQRLQGWEAKVVQGRPAILRDTCMDCVNANFMIRELKAETHRKAMALEKEGVGEENFYLLLADVDGAY